MGKPALVAAHSRYLICDRHATRVTAPPRAPIPKWLTQHLCIINRFSRILRRRDQPHDGRDDEQAARRAGAAPRGSPSGAGVPHQNDDVGPGFMHPCGAPALMTGAGRHPARRPRPPEAPKCYAARAARRRCARSRVLLARSLRSWSRSRLQSGSALARGVGSLGGFDLRSADLRRSERGYPMTPRHGPRIAAQALRNRSRCLRFDRGCVPYRLSESLQSRHLRSQPRRSDLTSSSLIGFAGAGTRWCRWWWTVL